MDDLEIDETELDELHEFALGVGWSLEIHHSGGFAGDGEATIEGHGHLILVWADSEGHASVTVAGEGHEVHPLVGHFGDAIRRAFAFAVEATPPDFRMARFMRRGADRYAAAVVPVLNPAWDDGLCRAAYNVIVVGWES